MVRLIDNEEPEPRRVTESDIHPMVLVPADELQKIQDSNQILHQANIKASNLANYCSRALNKAYAFQLGGLALTATATWQLASQENPLCILTGVAALCNAWSLINYHLTGRRYYAAILPQENSQTEHTQ